jgi:hypothetical protein
LLSLNKVVHYGRVKSLQNGLQHVVSAPTKPLQQRRYLFANNGKKATSMSVDKHSRRVALTQQAQQYPEAIIILDAENAKRFLSVRVSSHRDATRRDAARRFYIERLKIYFIYYTKSYTLHCEFR